MASLACGHSRNDHFCQFQAVADFRVNHRRVLDFLAIQSDCRDDGSRDQLRIFSSRGLPRSLEAFW